MRLISAQVTNFRSVDDCNPFEVGQVTCLVGKNEAGKSAILMALASLNPHSSTPAVLDKERDYPRRLLTQYGERHSNEEAVAVTTTWKLDQAETDALASVVGKGVVSEVVTVLRRYGKQAEVKAELSFKPALEFLYSKFLLDAPERSVLASVSNTTQLIEALKNLASPTAKHQALSQHLATHGTVTAQVNTLILGKLPKFMYFSSYDRMEGAIQLEATRQLIDSGQIANDSFRGTRLFVDFLDYAGVSMGDIASVSTYETFNARLQAASNNITDQILEYWTQNPDLNVVVRVEQARSGDPAPFNSGTIARARIDNNLHRVDTPFSERSAGFVWFFSFLVKFARVKEDSSPVVLLLDEPGLTLHGKAQADLLRFLKEKLAPHHQIIYSTHSPFMVPADDFASVRIVEDQVELKGVRRVPLGTKVRDDALSRDPDTLFPLQGALGYDISQSLFVGKHILLVEGPGDILYIQALTEALRRRGRIGLDSRWTICPAGGIDKISPFVALFAGNSGLQVAVLADQGVGDKKKIEQMRRSEILAAGHFHTMAGHLDRPEADIEDLFEPAVFSEMLNACYSLNDMCRVTPEKLAAADVNTSRLLKQAEAAFKLMPESVPMFDHFTPASWLIRNPAFTDAETAAMDATLNRAEKVFKVYNDLL